jgi:inosine-uridine nucleoside N-ribohydrolase
MKKIVVDTDPGIDDALALLYLEARNDVEISAITVSPGNGSQEQCLKNLNQLKKLSDISAPVFKGAKEPLEKSLETSNSHGDSGFGNLSVENRLENSGSATNALREYSGEDRHLLCLAPLTNIAKSLEKKATLLEEYNSVTIMGGAINTFGNINRVAEFNFWVDPDAADTVINSKGEKLLVPVNVCRSIVIDSEVLEGLLNKKWMKRLIQPYIEYYENKTRFSGPVMYDPLAAGIAIDKIGTSQSRNLKVESKGKYTRGMTVPELRPQKNPRPNSSVQQNVEADEFIDNFLKNLKKFGDCNGGR